MSNWMAEEAAAQHAMGLSCSFDCYACEIKGLAHLHPCIHEACVEPQTSCYDEACFYEESTDAAFPCNAHSPKPPAPPAPAFDPTDDYFPF